MAWEEDYARKRSKEADGHLRSERNRAAVADQLADPTPAKKKARDKKFGLTFYYRSFFSKKEAESHTEWYETVRAREVAYSHGLGQTVANKPRWTRIEKVSR